VVEDLVRADFARHTISLITNDAQNQYSRYLAPDYHPPEDAVTGMQGAGFGAVVGALTGILVGLTALIIPGIGLVMVAGPVVAGLTGAVVGTLTGGLVGALVKSGIAEDVAPYYAEGIRRGGTLISIVTTEVLQAQAVINRHGSVNIHERVHLWRRGGWQGFDVDNQEPRTEPPLVKTETSLVSFMPITHQDQAPARPAVLEPPLASTDTPQVPAQIVGAPPTPMSIPSGDEGAHQPIAAETQNGEVDETIWSPPEPVKQLK
jgi:hypothetical protein